MGARVRETVGIELVALATEVAGGGIGIWPWINNPGPRWRSVQPGTTPGTESNGALAIFEERGQADAADGTAAGILIFDLRFLSCEWGHGWRGWGLFARNLNFCL